MKHRTPLVFRPVPGERSVVLNFRRRPQSEFDIYARPYHDAARALARRVFRSRTARELDALPIVFLYRHALELSMKAVVLEGNRRLDLFGKGLPTRELWTLLNGHRLTRLLPAIRQVFKKAGWQWYWEDPTIRTFGRVRRLLRELETVDPESFSFRYPTNTRGEASVPHHFEFNLHKYVTVVDPLVEAFDTVAFGMSAEYGQITDALSEQVR